MKIFWVAAVAAATLCAVARAHTRWAAPVPRSPSSGLKTSPCGTVPGKDPITLLLGGTTHTLHYQETVCHIGSPYRIALSAGATDVSGCFNEHVLLDHIPHDDAGCYPNVMYSINITIPDVNCEHCVLQLTQMMTDKSQLSCNGSLPEHWGPDRAALLSVTYYSCADVKIVGSTPLSQFQFQPTYPAGWLRPGVPYGRESADYIDGHLAGPASSFRYTSIATDLECKNPPVPCPGITDQIGAPYMGPAFSFCNTDRNGADPPNFCVQWQVVNNSLALTIEGRANGWIAFGISPSESMLGADVYQCTTQADGTGGTVVARHVSTSLRVPATYAAQHVSGVVVERRRAGYGSLIDGAAVLHCEFARPLLLPGEPTAVSLQQAVHLIWALHASNVDINAGHTEASDTIPTANLLLDDPNIAVGPLPDDTTYYEIIMFVHAVAMFAGWGVLSAIAVYVATFARTYKHWFRVHAALQVFTAALVTAGFAIVVSGKSKMGSPHFASVHEIVGLLVFIIMWLQIAMGITSNRLYNPARGRRRTVDYLHIWVGGSLQLAALINIFLGLAWGGAGTGYMVGYGLWFAAVMALYAFKFLRTTASLQGFFGPKARTAPSGGVELRDDDDDDDAAALKGAHRTSIESFHSHDEPS